MNGAARRHPWWGIVAQVTGAVGVALLVLMIALTWVGYSYTDEGLHGLVGDMDIAAAKAVEQANAVATALDEQAAQNGNDPDTQALLKQGAGLAREAGSQVTTVQGQIGDLSDAVRLVLTGTAALGTGVMVYLILIHAGVWTLGRHWRRD